METKQYDRKLDVDSMTPEQLILLLGDWETFSFAYETLLLRGKSALVALIQGLQHPNGKIRARCALLMDHLGDDRCTAPLIFTLKNDPLEAVRRCALHSLACQTCKECPLEGDIIAPILDAALSDRSKQVRRRAVEYLSLQRPDPRVAEAMSLLIATESDPIIKKRAARTLTFHEQPANPAAFCSVKKAP